MKSTKKNIGKKSVDDQELLDEYLERQIDIGKSLDPSLMTRFEKISKMFFEEEVHLEKLDFWT